MSNASAVPALPDDDFDIPIEKPAVQPHVRLITTLAALPWDQAKAASLEARSGAPLPLDQLALTVKRLGPWRRGVPGRFAAVYVRRDEVGERLEVPVHLDGAEASVSFLSPAEQRRRYGGLMAVVIAAAAATFMIAVGAGMALDRRAATEAELQRLEQQANTKAVQVRRGAALAAQNRAIAIEQLDGRSVGDLLADLDWLSAAKAPDARVRAVHWDHGYLALEAKGDASPLLPSNREVRRAERPVEQGVWLWGVEEADDR